MRPTPAETAAGVARILSETVAPAVTDVHARAQLAQVIAVLGQVPWDDAAFIVMARTASTVELLAECEEWIEGDPDRRATFGVVGVTAESSPPQSFGEANERLHTARAALERFVDTLRAWRAERGPESSQDLLERLSTVLAQ